MHELLYSHSFAYFITLHTFFALIIAILAFVILKKHYLESKKSIFAFFFVFVLALPYVGEIFGLILIYYLYRINYIDDDIDIKVLYLDNFYVHFPVIKRRFGEGAFHDIIENEKIPAGLKLSALTMLAEHKDKVNIALIKRMLSSKNDELRLFSFSVIDKMEQSIHKQIHETTKRYESKQEPKAVAIEAKELAHLYWELIYFELADEVLSKFLLEEVEKYCRVALEVLTQDKECHLLLGRLYFERGDDDAAERSFNIATALDLGNDFRSASYIAPYLAEIHYRRRNFRHVKALITQANFFDLHPKLQPIQRVWAP